MKGLEQMSLNTYVRAPQDVIWVVVYFQSICYFGSLGLYQFKKGLGF